MQPARRQALALASATLRRASGAGTSTSSSSASGSVSGGNAGGGGSLFDRCELTNQSFFARGFASRRPKVAVLLKEDVEGLGEAGTEASVRPGYARNALLPRGAAELVPHRRARREARPPRSVLQQLEREKEEEEKAMKASLSSEAAAAAASPAEAEGEGEDDASSAPARLVAVARSLSRGALEFVRPLRPDGKDDESSSSSFSTSTKIAEPIDAAALAAAVAAQKRIALDPRLIILEKGPIDEQGEHLVPLRMKMGGERVVVRALVGLAAASSSSGGGGEKGKKKGGKQ